MRFNASVSSFLGPKLGIDEMSAQGLVEDSKSFAQNVRDIAGTHAQGLNNKAKIASAKNLGEAQSAAAGSAANAAIFGGAMGAVTGIAGGIDFGGGGGNASTSTDLGVFNLGTLDGMDFGTDLYKKRFAGDALGGFTFRY